MTIRDAESRKRRIRTMWEGAWNEGRVELMDDVLSPHYVRYVSSSDVTIDREEFKQLILATREGFPDVMTSIEDILCEGDRVAIRWWSRGTHLGTYRDVPPTGRSVTAAGATFARFEDDMIVESWSTWDPRDMLSALGIISLSDWG